MFRSISRLQQVVGLSLLLGACRVDVSGEGEPALGPLVGVDAGLPVFVDHQPGAGLDASVDAPAHSERDAGALGTTDAARDGAALDAAESTRDAAPGVLVDAAALDALVPDAMTSDSAAASCSLQAPFSVELLFGVSWNETTLAGIVPLLKAGKGQIRIVVRLDLSGPPSAMRARLTACGAELPDFAASNVLIGTENYAAYIPERAWDQLSMPHLDFGLSFGCALPGCALRTEPVIATFGARASSQDAWPGRTGAIEQLVPLDQDADGHPGIAFISREQSDTKGTVYLNIPVTWTLGARATQGDIAFRLAGEFVGSVDGCDQFSGVVNAGSIEARAVGCRARRAGSSAEFACSDEEVSFLDENLPAWTVNGGSFRARRVAPDASCERVRAVWDSDAAVASDASVVDQSDR